MISIEALKLDDLDLSISQEMRSKDCFSTEKSKNFASKDLSGLLLFSSLPKTKEVKTKKQNNNKKER